MPHLRSVAAASYASSFFWIAWFVRWMYGLLMSSLCQGRFKFVHVVFLYNPLRHVILLSFPVYISTLVPVVHFRTVSRCAS